MFGWIGKFLEAVGLRATPVVKEPRVEIRMFKKPGDMPYFWSNPYRFDVFDPFKM